jgi:RNA polymerase sigma-70 factor (ECF subfamily)
VRTESVEEFRRRHRETLERLYRESGAGRFEIALSDFTEAVYRAYRRRAETGPSFKDADELETFLESLHVGDMALALGCRRGSETAWREFQTRFRSTIESAARALISDRMRARELSDSLYADLYGLRETAGGRSSPLDHYYGRAGLGAWLRVVVAQRAADSWRAARPFESLEAATERIAAGDGDSNDPDRLRYLPLLSDSMARVIRALPPSDKLLLSYYYVQGLKLAEIGRLLGDHESTISRRLSALRARIKDEVARTLEADHRLSSEQVRACFDYATDDWPFNLAEALSQAK